MCNTKRMKGQYGSLRTLFSLTAHQGKTCKSILHYNVPSQQTRHMDSMPDQCWATVCDAGPTLIRHWINVSFLLGCDSFPKACIQFCSKSSERPPPAPSRSHSARGVMRGAWHKVWGIHEYFQFSMFLSASSTGGKHELCVQCHRLCLTYRCQIISYMRASFLICNDNFAMQNKPFLFW